MLQLFLNEHFWMSSLPIIGIIIGFFFGTSGIFTKIFDLIFTAKKEEREKMVKEEKEREEEERVELTEIKRENVLLRSEVEKLRQEITILDKHLAENTIYMKTLLAWLEKAMPEGTNAFIAEMAREIREKNNIVH